MSSSQRALVTVLALVACALATGVAYLAWQTYQLYAVRPLGPQLAQSGDTPVGLPPSWTAAAPSTLAPLMAFGTPTPALAPRCGGPAVMTMLAIGSDARSNTYIYGLADVIRIVRVDFVTPRMAVLEFPRDLWVEIPEIVDDIGQDHEKLNQAYLYGNPGFGYYDHPSAGPGLLAQTLELNFGLHADHYVAVNMRTFEKVVDAVDGIDVKLEKTVDGRSDEDRSSRLLFAAGRHHLSGPEALTLARVRSDGVFMRAEHQNTVLCALREKLSRPEVVTRVPDLIAAFQDNIQTDLSIEQLGQLACIGTQLRPENVTFTAFPEQLFSQDRVFDPVFGKRVFVWKVDYTVLRDIVARFQAGLWPTQMPSLSDSTSGAAVHCP
jgi:LCP family protein required for cell wall assembly